MTEAAAPVVVSALETELATACGEGIEPNVKRWLRFAGVGSGDVVELQALDVPQERGAPASLFAHATSLGAVVRLLSEPWARRAPALYQILNRVDPRIAGRDTVDTWHRAKKGASTTDNDIVARVVLPIDLDVERPRGTSASAAEVAGAVARADVVYRCLSDLIGSDALALGHSGNGRWIAIALDRLEETKELGTLVREILAALAALHNAAPVHVDVACSDAKRLGPAWGTRKCKGSASAERPHRMTGIAVPAVVRRLTLADLQTLRDTLVARAPATVAAKRPALGVAVAGARGAVTATPGDGLFERANDVPIAEVAAELGLIEGDGVRCPGCGAGGSGDTSVALLHGRFLKCLHASCASVSKTGGVRGAVDLWAEVRGGSSRDAAIAICERFGVVVPAKNKPRATKAERAAERVAIAQAPAIGTALTDIGNAERLVAAHGPDLLFVPTWKKWMAWDGVRWDEDRTDEVTRRAIATARAMYAEAANPALDRDTASDVADHAKKSESASRLRDMLRVAQAKLPATPDSFDRDGWSFVAANGTVDLRSGELRPHSREERSTKRSLVAYDPSADAPTWRAFLERILPDPDVRAFVQKMVGYALTGDVREQVLFFAYGTGKNGKSTFASVLLDVLGDYGHQAPPSLLISRDSGEKHPTEIAALQGRRLVVTSETKATNAFDEEVIKQITGGDRISARFMKQDFFSFEPTHKLFFQANHKPAIRQQDEGIWRRIRLIPFDQTISEAERVHDMAERLRAELPGVLRWAVDGCLAWQDEGLKAPAAVLAATSAYREESDILGPFLDACCVVSADASAFSAQLLQAYEAWCRRNGETPVKSKTFSTRLQERAAAMGLEKTKYGGVMRWRGIGLKSGEDGEDGAFDGEDPPQDSTIGYQTAIQPEMSTWGGSGGLSRSARNVRTSAVPSNSPSQSSPNSESSPDSSLVSDGYGLGRIEIEKSDPPQDFEAASDDPWSSLSGGKR